MSFSLTSPKSVRSNLADFIQSTVFSHIITVSSKVYTDRPCLEYCRYSSLFQSIFGRPTTSGSVYLAWYNSLRRKNIDDVPDTVYRYIPSTVIMCVKTVLCIKSAKLEFTDFGLVRRNDMVLPHYRHWHLKMAFGRSQGPFNKFRQTGPILLSRPLTTGR